MALRVEDEALLRDVCDFILASDRPHNNGCSHFMTGYCHFLDYKSTLLC